jgi:hypothetical protein
MPKQDKYSEYIMAAIASPRGITIEAANPHSLRQKLYSAAKELAVTHQILITIGPSNSREVWIIKRSELNHDKVREPKRLPKT